MLRFSRSSLGAALVLALTSQYAQAQSCTPLDTVLGQVSAQSLAVEQFTGGDTARAVAFFNRIPPVSDDAFNLALLIALPDGSGVLAVGKDGAVCAQVRLSAEKLRAMTTLVKGISI
jgi:hypothetical protein